MESLITCVISNDPERVRVVLERYKEEGLDIDEEKDEFGRNSLLIASANDNVVIVNLLLEAGANVSVVDYKNKNALHLTQSLEVARSLISYGINVNELNSQGFHLIHCFRNRLDMCKLLLANGARIDDKYLHESIYRDNSEMVDLFLRYSSTAFGVSSQDMAARVLRRTLAADKVGCLRVVVQHAPNMSALHDDRTPLHHAQSSEAVDILVQITDNIDVKGGIRDISALYYACILNRPSVFRALLYHGASLNAKYKEETIVDRILRKQRQEPDYRAEILGICLDFEEGENIKEPVSVKKYYFILLIQTTRSGLCIS